MANLHIELPGLDLKNPVMPASGTFGYGQEFKDFYDLNKLGSISIKGTTREKRYGNPLPRIAEGPAGLLNAIGLQNPGVEHVVQYELPELAKIFNGKVLGNMGGHSFEDYVETAAILSKAENVGENSISLYKTVSTEENTTMEQNGVKTEGTLVMREVTHVFDWETFVVVFCFAIYIIVFIKMLYKFFS